MPRGVYKRKKRKSSFGEEGIPDGHVRMFIDLPAITNERLERFAEKQDKSWHDLVKKAIYDLIPVEYDAHDQYVFPFGKYQGETVASVKRIDLSYLDWCQKNISGFKMPERQAVGVEADECAVDFNAEKEKGRLRRLRNDNHYDKLVHRDKGERLIYSNNKIFARYYVGWGQGNNGTGYKYRYLGPVLD